MGSTVQLYMLFFVFSEDLLYILLFMCFVLSSPDDIGIYNGQLYGIDDIHHSDYHHLRSGLGIGGVGGVGVVGGVAVVGGAGVVGGGGIRVGGIGLRQCQRAAICTLQYIPPQCRYIPIFRDITGR